MFSILFKVFWFLLFFLCMVAFWSIFIYVSTIEYEDEVEDEYKGDDKQ